MGACKDTGAPARQPNPSTSSLARDSRAIRRGLGVLDKKLANTLGRAIALVLTTAATAQAAETDVKTMSTIRVQEDALGDVWLR